MVLKISTSIAVLLFALNQVATGSNLLVDNESMPVAQQTSGYQRESVESCHKIIQRSETLPSGPIIAERFLPHEIKVHILTFLTEQNDLLRIGATSKEWRQAAKKTWNTREFVFPRQKLTKHDYPTLGRGIFSCISIADKRLKDKDIEGWMKILSGIPSINLDERAGEKVQESTMVKLRTVRGQPEKLIFSWIASLCSVWRSFYPVIDRWQALNGNNASLTALDLSRNSIGAEGAQAIAKTLIHLTSLDLAWNRIGTEGAIAIAGKLTSLTRLTLIWNRIGNEGPKAIADKLTSLISLNLGYNSIGDKGATVIAEKLSRLISLNLYNSSIGTEGAIAIADNLTSLTDLNLSWNNIGDEGKKALKQLKDKNPKISIYIKGEV